MAKNASSKNSQTEMEVKFVGKILSHRNRITWKIPEFYKYPENGCTLYSPVFDILNRSWHLFLRLGRRLDIGVYQVTKNVSDFKVRLGINRGNIEFSCEGTLSCGGRGTFTLIDRSDIDKKRDFWVPNGHLDLFFVIEDMTRVNHSDKTCSQNALEVGMIKLQNDLEFLLKGDISDIVVRVQGTEFQCHRCILGARSPVFLSMVTHETKEKATGVIEIEDAHPNVFLDFLYYLYTGRAKAMTMEKVLDLYAVSDKYQVVELKNSCVDYMLDNISVEKFCDIVALSLRHNERKLTEATIEFFTEEWNSLEIIKTSKWQTFLSENSTTCNELFIKLLESLKS